MSAVTNSAMSYFTLKEIVEAMGDTGKTISYLKVDIEGAEIAAIPEWISSGILDNVSQFGIELHTGTFVFGKALDVASQNISKILEFIRNLYKLGFRLISNANNDCVEKSDDYEKKYLSLMEVVFYKEI
jgi:hypothetical protein